MRHDIYTWHKSSIWDMTHSYWHDSLTCDTSTLTWLINTWHDSLIRDMSRSYETWHVYVTWVIHMRHDTFILACLINMWHDSLPWPIRVRAMTHSYVCNDSFICVPWLIHMCAMTHSHVRYGILIFGSVFAYFRVSSRLMHDMTHSHMCHDSFAHVTWLIHICDTSHSYVWHNSFRCVTWLICTCDSTSMRHDAFKYVGYICRRSRLLIMKGARVPWLIHTCAMTYSHVWQYIYVPWPAQVCGLSSQPFFLVADESHTSAMTCSYVRYYIYGCHVSFVCVIWLTHMCNMTHSYVWQYKPVPWQIQESRLHLQAFSRASPENHMCDMIQGGEDS